MQFLMVSQRFVYWMGTLSWIFLFSGSVRGQIDVQNCLDSLTSMVESYSEFASRIALEKEAEIEATAGVEAMLDDFDRQREEARIDCLANRLLAEEYQPYDFDIRETMWCKGPFVAIVPSVPNVPESQWLIAIRSHVLSGFKAQMIANWNWALDHTVFFGERVQLVVSEIERQRLLNSLASTPTLRDVFGRSVLPNDIGLTREEYAKITIQLWNELRENALKYGVRYQSSWYPSRPTFPHLTKH